MYPHNSRIPPTRKTIVPIKSPIWQLRHVKDRAKHDVPATRDNRESLATSMARHINERVMISRSLEKSRDHFILATHASTTPFCRSRIDRGGISQTRRNLPLWSNAWSFALLRYDYAAANVTAAVWNENARHINNSSLKSQRDYSSALKELRRLNKKHCLTENVSIVK